MSDDNKQELEEASTRKTAKTHAGNVFVRRDLDLWPFDDKINDFSGFMVGHVYVKFGDHSCRILPLLRLRLQSLTYVTCYR